MADHGSTLGADLGDLYDAGRYGLPNCADELTKGATALPMPDFSWFDRAGDIGLAYYGPWSEMLDYANEIYSMLTTSATNISETGDTLVYIANHYHDVDSEAMAVFNTRKKELSDTATLQMGNADGKHPRPVKG